MGPDSDGWDLANPKRKKRSPLIKQWWFWGVTAAALGAATAGTILVIRALRPGPPPSATFIITPEG